MKIAVLSHRELIEANCSLYGHLRKAIERIGKEIDVDVIDLSKSIVAYEGGEVSFYFNDKNLLDYDAFVIRLTPSLQRELSYLIIKSLRDSGKIVINESHAELGAKSDKLSFLGVASELELKHPKTFFVNDYEGLENILDKIEFPFVAKDHLGWQGDTVSKIDNEEELQKLKKDFPKNGLIVQEYIPIKSDIRVLVVGYEAIGAIERFSVNGDFRTNISLGGEARKIEMTQEMKEISEKIAKETKNSILGVDFMEHKGELYVLEIGDCPGISGFMKYMGIKPMDNLIKYIIEQYESNKG